jgi:hypothetical protein
MSVNAYPPLSVGIINYNGGEVVLNTIAALRAAAYPGEVEIVVVDDRSTDDSPARIAATYPAVRLFIQEKNRGPNAARNRCLSEARHELVFITDNDVEVAPDTLALLVDQLVARPEAAVASPMVLDFDERDKIYSNGSALHYVGFGLIDDRYVRLTPALDTTPRKTVCGSGGIFLTRKNVALKLAGFDEHFIFGYDDGEFTYRVSSAGYDVVHTPAARVYHIEKPGRNPARRRFQIKGRLSLMFKCYATRSLILLAPALIAFELALVGLMIAKGTFGEWVRGVALVWGERASLMARRRATLALKKTPDNRLLDAREIFMFGDVGGPVAVAKGIMESALALYWKAVSPFLGS